MKFDEQKYSKMLQESIDKIITEEDIGELEINDKEYLVLPINIINKLRDLFEHTTKKYIEDM